MRRKAVKRTLQPWTYIQAAVPASVRKTLELQADAKGISLAEVAGNALTVYAKHINGWQGELFSTVDVFTQAEKAGGEDERP